MNPGDRVGSFRIVRLLGEGGMGQVYEAFNDEIHRRAAIKVLRPEYARDVDMAGRFANEARAVNIVGHPGIVSVFDAGSLPTGAAYIVMEFLDGESLRRRMVRLGGSLGIDSLRFARQTAVALAAAHARGIIHRENYIISIVCFHVGHLGPQRRRNKPCTLTVPAAARSALTSH